MSASAIYPTRKTFKGYNKFTVIVPSDSANQSFKALYVGGAGNAVVVDENGNTFTFSGLLVGNIYEISGTRVNSTSTTASLMIGLDYQ